MWDVRRNDNRMNWQIEVNDTVVASNNYADYGNLKKKVNKIELNTGL